jgi:type I restriction enzyme R subunit
MSGEAYADFAAFIPNGDVKTFAAGLTTAVSQRFVETMALLRAPAFQDLLENYKRAPRQFLVADGVDAQVSSEFVFRDGQGVNLRPEDYIEAFAKFVRENPEHIEAIRILLDRPRDWKPSALTELRHTLRRTNIFTETLLQEAHRICYKRALVDIISMVKHAADAHQPLLTAQERVGHAIDRLAAGQTFTPDQAKWMDLIRTHLVQNLSIDTDDFDDMPLFNGEGGISAARRAFGGRFTQILHDLNEALAA